MTEEREGYMNNFNDLLHSIQHFLRLFLLLIFTYSPYLSCAQKWIELKTNQNKPYQSVTFEVLESSFYEYDAKVNIHGIYDKLESYNGVTFHNIFFDEYSQLTDIGKPALPLISKQIIIPENATAQVSISEGVWDTIPIGKILPAQRPILESANSKDFCCVDSIYKKMFCPPLYQIGEVLKWRGVSCTSIEICPFKYYPEDNLLLILTSFELNITFVYENKSSNSSTNYHTKELCHNIFDNSNLLESNMTSYTQNDSLYDYLIVAGSIPGLLESQELKNFTKWKAFKGLKTKVVEFDSIGTSCEHLKSYIHNEFNNTNGRLHYVLFIGDEDIIPIKTDSIEKKKAVTTDYWYGCFAQTNNGIADVAIGRFPSDNLAEISNMINKTISYESRPTVCANDILLIAHWKADEYYPKDYQNCLNRISNSTFNYPKNFIKAYGQTTQEGGTNATNEDIINIINSSHPNIVNYRGHGIPNYWPRWNFQNAWFNSSQICNMNDSVCSVFLSIACQNGNIQDSLTCMMETFLRPSHGAVAFLGATEDTWRDVNNRYNKFIYNSLLNDGIYRIGDLNIAAHLRGLSSTYGYYVGSRDNAYSYLIGGDPSLELWTQEPNTMSNIDISYLNGVVSIDTNNSDSVLVSFVTDEGVLAESRWSSGPFTHTISGIGYIVISKHNFYPCIIKFDTESHTIQNTTFIYNTYYTNTPLLVGYDVTSNQAYGPVLVKDGCRLHLQKGTGVTVKNCFYVEKGAVFKIE